MLYFLDTDFVQTDSSIDLISIAVIAEDGREYFAVSMEFDADQVSPRLREKVLACLPDSSSGVWKTRSEIRADLAAFFGSDSTPEVWGHCVAYSFVLLTQLWGLDNLPTALLLLCYEIQQLLDSRAETAPEKTGRRTALDGARWTQEVYMLCTGAVQAQGFEPGDVVDVDYWIPMPKSGRRRFLCRGVVERLVYDRYYMVTLLGRGGRRSEIQVSLHHSNLRLICRLP